MVWKGPVEEAVALGAPIPLFETSDSKLDREISAPLPSACS